MTNNAVNIAMQGALANGKSPSVPPLTDIKEASTAPNGRSVEEAEATFVNTEGNGKRMMLAEKVVFATGAVDTIQVAWNDKGVFVGPAYRGAAIATRCARAVGNSSCTARR